MKIQPIRSPQEFEDWERRESERMDAALRAFYAREQRPSRWQVVRHGLRWLLILCFWAAIIWVLVVLAMAL